MRIRRIAFALLPTLILLLVCEGAARAYYRLAVLDDFMAIDISDSFHNIPDLFERRRGEDGRDLLFSRYFPTRYYVSDRNYRGKTMAAEKTLKTFRVFTYGGSSTAGSPWGHEASFSRFLEDELNALRRAGTIVEVVNFGAGGYGSTRALGLVEASMKYRPDLVVFYEGHNEMSDNWIYQDVAQASLNSGIRRLANYSYTFKLATMLLSRQAKPPERVDLLQSNAMFVPKRIAEKKGFKARDREYLRAQFRQNLIGIIGAAAANGSPVLLVSQPSNFFYEPSWYPTPADAAQASLVSAMRAAYGQDDISTAAARANAILAENPENAVAHFFAGLAAIQAGQPLAAREHLLAAIDFDESPERYTRAYRDVERTLTDGRRAFFVDAWQAAIRASDDGLLDGRLFVDKMHPTVEGNKLIARTIVTDYFVGHRVREDLFDYTRDDPERIWRDNIDPAFYHVICARYFDIADAGRCVDEIVRRQEAAPARSPDRRIYRSSWEYLFYYGLLTHDSRWVSRSTEVWKSWSVAAAAHRAADEGQPVQ